MYTDRRETDNRTAGLSLSVLHRSVTPLLLFFVDSKILECICDAAVARGHCFLSHNKLLAKAQRVQSKVKTRKFQLKSAKLQTTSATMSRYIEMFVKSIFLELVFVTVTIMFNF